ncbi:hypothetical protein IW261DRAFT_1426457 [Armillaria novae-zelandiae]|uniref:Uncharacterized protein n=1 Tax=Armillaria novae-zelandiae TaxID=153914 RepID=A0AA39NLA0_9AGAR|nr:hypothetical protein IW261DRAFT_1426457 [Armillaria novae-zelandiae]
MVQELAATYPPTFNAPDADAILSSLDNTLYRLPSPVLRCTTFVFPSFTFEPPSKPISIHEHDTVLERLLQILSSLAIALWRAFDDLEVFLREPLRVFAIASKHTLDLSLHEVQHQEALRRIPMHALVRLFNFHRQRRGSFRVGMAGEGKERRCVGCGKAAYERSDVLERTRKCLDELPDTV